MIYELLHTHIYGHFNPDGISSYHVLLSGRCHCVQYLNKATWAWPSQTIRCQASAADAARVADGSDVNCGDLDLDICLVFVLC